MARKLQFDIKKIYSNLFLFSLSHSLQVRATFYSCTVPLNKCIPSSTTVKDAAATGASEPQRRIIYDSLRDEFQMFGIRAEYESCENNIIIRVVVLLVIGMFSIKEYPSWIQYNTSYIVQRPDHQNKGKGEGRK